MDVNIRKAKKSDAKSIYHLVKESGILDLNSEYLYLLQCTHFSNVCATATIENEVVGFVSGYIHPKDPTIFFVWQVGVTEKARGKSLATEMIMNILRREELKNIHYVHTTISPSNRSSQRVFEKLAKKLNADIEKETLFAIDDFSNGHEEETLYNIGKINLLGITDENI